MSLLCLGKGTTFTNLQVGYHSDEKAAIAPKRSDFGYFLVGYPGPATCKVH